MADRGDLRAVGGRLGWGMGGAMVSDMGCVGGSMGRADAIPIVGWGIGI